MGEPCLPPAALERLRINWNKTHPSHIIPQTRKNKRTGGKTRRHRGDVKEPFEDAIDSLKLYDHLKKAMKTHYKCETEFCMAKKISAEEDKGKILKYFKPEKPAEWDEKPTQWLDSFNIEDVMKQYEEAIPDFEFIGPVPIDFDSKPKNANWGQCIVDELCKLDIERLKRSGKYKIGIIFNLDKHDEPGSHWVCSYIDINNSSAYYFDSYGYKPPKEIVKLLERLKSQGITNIYYNDIRHQRKGSECGMYCLCCIICLLRGKSFYEICTNVIDDDTINAFRDVIFAEEKPRKEALEEGLKKLCT
jgi:hypothetical protein